MLRGLIEARLGRYLVWILLLALGAATVLLLSGGRDALKAVGLSHTVAGAIATAFTVVLVVIGLAYFAIHVIDWE